MPSAHFIGEVGWLRFLIRFARRQATKRLLGRGVSLRLPSGLTMQCPPWSPSASEAFYTASDVDWGSEALMFAHLDGDGTFIDVGAHVGYYALWMAPAVCRVYAFEPDRRSFAALTANLAACPHAEAVGMAVDRQSGTMDVAARADAAGFVRRAGIGRDDATVPVEAVSIDDWMAARPDERVTGIKIDVDGADFDVLQGADAVLRRDAPLVLTEFLPTGTNRYAPLFGFIGARGYTAFAFHRGDARTVLKRLVVEGTAPPPIKMIFLVPARLTAAFDARCG